MRIHVVDDDPPALALAKSVLERAGHRVSVSASSDSALDEIRSSRPDCVLLDIMMPGIDGLELCRQMRDSPDLVQTKIVMLSGKVYDADRRQALAVGADGFLRKPVQPESFAGDLQRLVSDQMRMTFWGVRGTLPVPGARSLRYGGNTSCVALELPKDRLWIFDAGSGIRELSNHVADRRPLEAKIFISHPHWDHINSIPFFAPLYVPGNELEILGTAHGDLTTRQLIAAQMDGIYFPITMKEFGARVEFRDLNEGRYEVDGISVRTMLLSHPGYCLGYRVDLDDRSFCYVTDNELFLPTSEYYSVPYVERLVDFVRDADVLITDTTYTDEKYASRERWGHSSVSQVVELADRAGVGTLYPFHHDPEQGDEEIEAKHEACVRLLAERDSTTRCVTARERDQFPV